MITIYINNQPYKIPAKIAKYIDIQTNAHINISEEIYNICISFIGFIIELGKKNQDIFLSTTNITELPKDIHDKIIKYADDNVKNYKDIYKFADDYSIQPLIHLCAIIFSRQFNNNTLDIIGYDINNELDIPDDVKNIITLK